MPDNLNPANPDTNPHERFLVLVVRYFDGDLDRAETAELNALLRGDPERRRQFAEYAAQCSRVRETFHPRGHELDVLPGRVTGARTPGRPARRRRVVLLAGVAGLVAAIATAAVVVWQSSRTPHGPQVVGSVERDSGDVRVINPVGDIRMVEGRADVRSGDTVRTEGPRGAAAVAYPDGTRLTLVGDTVVTCSGNGLKSVVVHQGTVGASVRPQPEGSPMVVATPAARIEVRGTEFCCVATPDRTDVSVTRGSVRVVRASDGRAVEVPEGKRVLAEGRAELAVEDIPRLPDAWELDFEQGLPADFRRGRFVTDGLPRGSKGGMASIRADHGDDGIFHEIATPDGWYRGLFAVHADTHVHFTFKMERPGWINVFVMARGADPKGPHSGNYLFNELRVPQRGQWRTATIPLSEFRRAGFGKGPPLSPEEVPYLVLFSSLRDRGLVIDRVWVTRGGPGVVQYRDAE